jgi:hypothetical protein
LIEICRVKKAGNICDSERSLKCSTFTSSLHFQRNRVGKINKSQASSGSEVNLGPKWTGNNHALVMKQRRVSQIKNLSLATPPSDCVLF